MNQFLVTVILAIFVISINIAHAEERYIGISDKIEFEAEQSKNEVESVKQKRGIVSGYGYPIPNVGLHYHKHSPYARFPSVYRGLGGSYVLTPGTASVHSYSINYPKTLYSKPLYHSHPRIYYPTVYANRYPFIPKPSVSFVPTPSFAAAPVPAFAPNLHTQIHPFSVQPQFIPNISPTPVFPQPQIPSTTLFAQNAWKPVFTQIPQTAILPHVHHVHQIPQAHQVPQVSPPSFSVLPPLVKAGSGNTPNVNNFYLPPRHTGTTQINEHVYSNDELAHVDEYYHEQQQRPQQDLQAHLQQLEQSQNFFRGQNNEGPVVPLPEQGYENASNNGRYTGLSSYDVPLNSRGRLAHPLS